MEVDTIKFIIEIILRGVMIGSVYGLIASGLSLIFGVGKIVNFSHGVLLTIGMFTIFYITTLTGINVYLATIIGAALVFMLGYAIQAFLITPILKREKGVPVLPIILLTAGLSMVVENVLLFLFGADYQTIDMGRKSFQFLGMHITHVRLIAFIISIVVIVLLQLFLTHTRLGRAIRAVSQDKERSRLLGVDDYYMYKITFALGTAVAAIAGGALLPFYYVQPYLGNAFLTKSFIIVVLGGMGNIIGAFAGGIIIGIIEVVGAQFMKITQVQALIFLIFVGFLVFKPTGLFGREKE